MQQVLIVTCDRDRWQFELQCKSMGKFLDSCSINIIINEKNPASWYQWFNDNCSHHLVTHSVVLFSHAEFMDCLDFGLVYNIKSGWITQQIFKMAFAVKTTQDYIVLDSKNWFIKPTNLLDIGLRQRRWKDHNYTFTKFVESCNQKFNLPEHTAYRPAITPYRFQPRILLELFQLFHGLNEFVSWFVSFKDPSEFIVYDLYAQSINEEQELGDSLKIAYNIFHGNIDTVEAQYYSNILDIEHFAHTVADPQVKLITASVVLLQDDHVRQAVERLLPLD